VRFFHARYGRASWQVFGLAGYLLASASQFTAEPVLIEAFVPAYRCGAVPDSPDSLFSLITKQPGTIKYLDYSGRDRAGQMQSRRERSRNHPLRSFFNSTPDLVRTSAAWSEARPSNKVFDAISADQDNTF
jgi:hypothetical protein